MNASVSIIIPVYNVIEYLEQCLDSVVNQTYKNIEIVIIDDGSTDGSREICERYQKKYEQILFISQNNQGVARARKNAFEYISGEYVGFIDADDYVDVDFVQELVENINEFDMITSGYRRDNDEIATLDTIQSGEYVSEEEMKYLISNMIIYNKGRKRGLTSYIWNKLFKANIAKEVFEEINDQITIAEDSDFLYRYVLKCKSVKVTNYCGYYYRLRMSSAVHSVNSHYLKDINDLYFDLEKVFSQHICKDSLLLQLQLWISRMLMGATSMLGFQEEARNIKYIFPFINLLDEKKVVIYGAGKVGQNYIVQIKRMNCCEVVIWVDKEWMKYGTFFDTQISPIEGIQKVQFDYLIIAVLNENVAGKIKNNLIAMGIDEKKILWKEPVDIVI